MSIATKSYWIGAVPRLVGTFSVASVNTDPTTVTFRMMEPNGTVTTYVYGTAAQLVRSAAGVFHVDWTADQQGLHCYRFDGTGVAQAVGEREFVVVSGCFAP